MGLGPWWRIGWRNLGRNRRRTAITAGALAFGYLAVVVMVGLVDGLTAEMIENGTGLVSGQLQVHARGYLPERSLHETIGGAAGADVEELVREVMADPAIEAAAPRVYAGGLLSSGAATTAVLLMGVDPELELRVSRLVRGVVRGRPPAADRNEVVIGVEAARQLDVDVGHELVLVAPAADGSLGNDLYTVSGIFESGLAELDGSYAVLPLRSFQRLLVLDPGRVHEVAAATADPWWAPEAAERLAENLAPLGLGLEVEPWTRLRPEMVDYARLVKAWNWVMLVIVFSIAVFGVANTMLMATFERRREFALVLAMGGTPPKVVLTVLCEALALGLLSLALGGALTLPLMAWWHNAPPDLSWLYGDFTIVGALIRPVLRVEYSLSMAIWTAVALLATALVAAAYPAARAARLPPADVLAGP